MKKLYISDLDGTLLQPNAELSSETISIINELMEQGMNFTVATARSIASVKFILEELKLSLPVILMNGVCIYDLKEQNYLRVETFSKESIQKLLSIIKEYRLKGLAYTIKDGAMSTYYEELNTKALWDFCQERINKYQKQFIQVSDFLELSEEPMMYFTLLDSKEKLTPVHHAFQQISGLNCSFYKDNYSPDLWYLEAYASTASKSQAVNYLRKHLDYDYITCFGDNRNDLPLYEASDYKLAVGNAVAEIKEKADLVIGNNYEDGVAAWLKQTFIKA